MPRNQRKEKSPRLYNDLAEWFHLLTPPQDYCDEAQFYGRVIKESSIIPVNTVLELGSGGGNNASHMKSHFAMTLTDLSEDMLAISRTLNPECEHVQGDMRNIRLGRQFDAVFIHDAISYMASIDDLAMTIETAFVHCKPGGAALFTPDNIRETFEPSTHHGGNEAGDRSLRYLEWTRDADPDDTSYIVDMVYLLKEGENVRCEYEQHILGLFSEDDWLGLIRKAGFISVNEVPYPESKEQTWLTPVFTGVRPEEP